MSTPVTFNGVTYNVPANAETNWGTEVSNFLLALGTFSQTTVAQVQASRLVTSTPANVQTTDYAVYVNVATPASVVLPSASVGQVFVIKDTSGAGLTNNITITPPGGQTIDGAASYVLSDNSAGVVLQFRGSNSWQAIAAIRNPSPTFGSITVTSNLTLSSATANLPLVANGSKQIVSKTGSANQLLGYDAAGTSAEAKTLSGTASQITVSHGVNTITLATPQNIATGSSPTFAGITVGSGTGPVKLASGVLATSAVDLSGTEVTNTLPFGKGGTGLSFTGTANQVLGTNNVGNALEHKTIAGTINQIVVVGSAGAITLSTPQAIASSSSPTFAGLTVGTLSGPVKASTGVLSASAVSLTSEVSGVLPTANGGTGINNAGTLTYGSNNIALTTSGATALTLPTSGTVATTAGTQVLTNKDFDGGTASVSSRITIPKDTTTNLNALARKQGTLVYDTTTSQLKYDDGSNLVALGVSAGTVSGSGTTGTVTVWSGGTTLAASAVTTTELGYVSGVTSALQTQLGGKEPTIAAGTTAQYRRGDKTWQTLNQAAVAGLTTTDAVTLASLALGGTAGAGYVEVAQQSSTPTSPASGKDRFFPEVPATGATAGLATCSRLAHVNSAGVKDYYGVSGSEQNYLFNGDCRLWQAGTTQKTSADNSYFPDGFRIPDFTTNLSALLIDQGSTTPLPGHTYYLRYRLSTSAAVTPFIAHVWEQRVEADKARELAGEVVTVSFWVRTSVARASGFTLGVNLNGMTGQNNSTFTTNTAGVVGGLGNSYVYSNAYSGAISANTWTQFYYTFTMPSQSATVGLTIENGFQVSAALSYTTAGAESATEFWFGGMKLNKGPVPTKFSLMNWSPGGELQYARRFYDKTYEVDTAPGTGVAAGYYLTSVPTQSSPAGNTIITGNAPRFSVEMVKTPTVTLYTTTGASGQWNISGLGLTGCSASTISRRAFEIQNASGGTLTITVNHFSGHFVADARL